MLLLLLLASTPALADTDTWFDNFTNQRAEERRHQETVQAIRQAGQPSSGPVVMMPATCPQLSKDELARELCRMTPDSSSPADGDYCVLRVLGATHRRAR